MMREVMTMMKKNIIVILFFMLFCFQINVYAEDECGSRQTLAKIGVYKDKIMKVDGEGNLLSGAQFILHDPKNKVSIMYEEQSPGIHELSMYYSRCLYTPLSYSTDDKPVLKKLSNSMTSNSAGEMLSQVVISQFDNIYYIEDWDRAVKDYTPGSYEETTNSNGNTTRKTHILFPMFIDEVETPQGYAPAKRKVVLLSGVVEISYYSYGYIYNKVFKYTNDVYYYNQTYYEYDKDYNYNKMYSLNNDDWIVFQEKYTNDDFIEDCHDENICLFTGDIYYDNEYTPSSCGFEYVCDKTHKIVNVEGNVVLELTNSINDNDSIAATRGDTVQYKSVIKNTGNIASYNILVKTIVPEELEYIKNSANFGGVYDPDTRTVTWDISKLDAGNEAELKYKATVATDVADLGSIQLRSVATSDEYPNEIDSGEVTIEVQKKSTAFVENATEVIKNPKTGSLISTILCLLSMGIVFMLNYFYQKKRQE